MTSIPAIARRLQAMIRQHGERVSQRQGPILLAATGLTAVLIGVLVASPRTLRSTYLYAEGDFATATVRAPFDLSIRDEEGTARLREETARNVIPVAVYDSAPVTVVPARIADVFDQAQKRIAEADAGRAVPEAELAKLGIAARRRMAQAHAHQADQAVQAAVEDMLPEVERQLAVILTPDERSLLGSGRFEHKLEEGLVLLVRDAYSRRIARDLRQLREAAESGRQPGEPARVIVRTSPTAPDRLLPNLASFDDVPGAVRRMRARAPTLLPQLSSSERAVLVGLAARLVVPDTVYDASATAQRRKQASADVLPIVLQFRRNQLIVDEGREVTREALLALQYLRQQALPQAFLLRAAGTGIVAWGMLAALLWLPARVGVGGVPLRDAAFALSALGGAAAACWGWLSVADGFAAAVPGVSRATLTLLFPVTAVPMLAGLVLPRRVFVGLCAAIAMCAGSLADLGIVFTVHTFVVGLVAGQLVVPCRQRSCIIRAGGTSALVAFVTGLSAVLLAGSAAGATEALVSASAAGVGAAAGGFFALALSRPVEWLFGYSTKLRLTELLSYDHPLLRRFMERAPGTFQHSVSVALLAQAAAEAVGADALLVRVGALYHDVGKLDSPQFFSENQRQASPHDFIEPRDSARVILAHTERGAELMARYRVGGRVADFAREHHGTGAVASFLQKAAAVGAEPDPADYRYPGPRPRSRETAVVMMADRVEAIVRSRGAATEEEFREVVGRTIDELLADGELDEAPLTLRDVARIREVFVTALMTLHHTREAYPALPRRL